MAVTFKHVMSWHGALGQTDEMASDSASVDLACMLAAFIKPKVVVEAGTYIGHMALALANIVRQVEPAGKVYTADVQDQGLAQRLEGEGQFLAPYIHFHLGDFLDMLKDVPGLIDLAYIDASSAEDPHLRMKHFWAVENRMREGGLILVDDTESKDWPDAKKFRDLSDIHLTQARGLSIFQRKFPWD